MHKLIGKVVSDKMDKTRLVEITNVLLHPIYKKAYPVSKKIKAHDKDNAFKTGDVVEIKSVKPISKQKAWVISRKVEE
jgi:small subunit ribosomal protein S17